MIVPWLLYGTVVGLLLATAAWLLELPLRQRGLPLRWIWLSALLALFALPTITPLLPRPNDAAPLVQAPITVAEGEQTAIGSRTSVSRSSSLPSVAKPDFDLDPWILSAWGFASAAIVVSFALSHGALMRRRRRWQSREVDGRTVWVSSATGPAVVGVFRGRVVLPEWLLRAPAEDRALVLAHEEEHIRAGDARLLFGVLLVWVVMPWNPGVWWIWRALRRAVEIDCDRRVLARGVDPRAYGRVLLDVTERGTSHRFAVAALSESQSFLERRIRLMIAKQPPVWGPRAAAALVLSFACIAAACQMDQPHSQPIVATGISMSPTQALPPDAPAAPADLVTPVLDPGPPSEANEARAFGITFRSILETRHPEVVSGAFTGDPVNLYVALDGNGDVMASAVDTEPRTGNCSARLKESLGIDVPLDRYDAGGCGRLDPGEAGPSRVMVFWQSLKSANEQERLAPTGDYLLPRILRRAHATPEQMTAAVQQHHPKVYRDGLTQGETLWFITDAEHRVLHTGRGWGYISSSAAQEDLERKVPGVRVGGITMGGVRAADGKGINVTWAREADPDVPPKPVRPDPYAQAGMFAITTDEPGREVTIRLAGQAAADPRSFRISGKFTNDDGVLTATTPFSFMVTTADPFSALLTLQGEGTMILQTETDGYRGRLRAHGIGLGRTSPNAPLSLTRGDGYTTSITLPTPDLAQQ